MSLALLDPDRLYDTVWHRSVEFDMQEPVGQQCAADLDPVRQQESPLELPRRDAAMEEHPAVIFFGLLPAHDELLVLDGQRQVVFREPGRF